MPVYKLDLIFEAGGHGWRETYYRNFEQATMGGVLTVAQQLAAKRAALNGQGILIKAYSVTDPLAVGRQGESIPFKPAFDGFLATAEQGAASPSASINVVWSEDATRLHRRIWMRGIWDEAIFHFNQLNSDKYKAWEAEFVKYRTYVLNKAFGWLHRPRAGESACSYTYPAGSQVPQFTMPADFFPVDQIGTFQTVRFSKFNGSDSTLNREMVVKVNSATVCEAAVPISAGPQTVGGKCIRYGTPEFKVAANIGVSRVGRRAPGRPLLLTPGRARARART